MYYIIIILFLLNLFIQNTLENNTCTSTYYCDDCEYCGVSTNNFTSCFFYNMVCRYSYLTLTYSPFMKNSLINYYKTFSDLTTFCGKSEIKFGNNNEINIFNSQNKTFPKDKYIHCYYSIKIANITQRKLYLNFDLVKNSNSKEARNLNFNFIIIFKEPDGTENIESIDQDYLRSRNTVEKYLNNENEVEIYLDFMELNYLDPEEILKINLINFKTQSKKSSSSSGSGAAIGGGLGGVVGLIIIVVIIYYCCCNKKQASTAASRSTTFVKVDAFVPVKK